MQNPNDPQRHQYEYIQQNYGVPLQVRGQQQFQVNSGGSPRPGSYVPPMMVPQNPSNMYQNQLPISAIQQQQTARPMAFAPLPAQVLTQQHHPVQTIPLVLNSSAPPPGWIKVDSPPAFAQVPLQAPSITNGFRPVHVLNQQGSASSLDGSGMKQRDNLDTHAQWNASNFVSNVNENRPDTTINTGNENDVSELNNRFDEIVLEDDEISDGAEYHHYEDYELDEEEEIHVVEDNEPLDNAQSTDDSNFFSSDQQDGPNSSGYNFQNPSSQKPQKSTADQNSVPQPQIIHPSSVQGNFIPQTSFQGDQQQQSRNFTEMPYQQGYIQRDFQQPPQHRLPVDYSQRPPIVNSQNQIQNQYFNLQPEQSLQPRQIQPKSSNQILELRQIPNYGNPSSPVPSNSGLSPKSPHEPQYQSSQSFSLQPGHPTHSQFPPSSQNTQLPTHQIQQFGPGQQPSRPQPLPFAQHAQIPNQSAQSFGLQPGQQPTRPQVSPFPQHAQLPYQASQSLGLQPGQQPTRPEVSPIPQHAQLPNSLKVPSSPKPQNNLPSSKNLHRERSSSKNSDRVGNQPRPMVDLQMIDRQREETKKNGTSQDQFDFAMLLLQASSDIVVDGLNDPREISKWQELKENLGQEGMKNVKKLSSNSGLGRPPLPDAMFFLAECHGSGFQGTPIDHHAAFTLYNQASKQSHAASTYRTAVCYEIGAGTKKDNSKAVQFYRKAAALGDTTAMYKCGMILLKGQLDQPKNLREAVTWLKRAKAQADENTPHAIHELALLHEDNGSLDTGIIPDPDYAHSLYLQAAQLGYAPSQYKLGLCYEYGQLGQQKDSKRSIAWYTRAAAQDDPESMLALSGWYLTGAESILGQSDKEAFLWAQKSADTGLAKAEYAVGYYFEQGIGVKTNISEAKKWYTRASGQ
ncbi:hypothetical protein HK096_002577, partial [Nowakowskiella sp. JEL0078]